MGSWGCGVAGFRVGVAGGCFSLFQAIPGVEVMPAFSRSPPFILAGAVSSWINVFLFSYRLLIRFLAGAGQDSRTAGQQDRQQDRQ